MSESTVTTFISWVAFVFLIVVGLESSLRFSDEFKTKEREWSFALLLVLGYKIPIRLSACILFAVIVIFSEPLSSIWAVMIIISNILFLNLLWRRVKAKNTLS